MEVKETTTIAPVLFSDGQPYISLSVLFGVLTSIVEDIEVLKEKKNIAHSSKKVERVASIIKKSNTEGITHTLLLAKTRFLSRDERAFILSSLMSQGAICTFRYNLGLRGRPLTVYVWTDHVEAYKAGALARGLY